MKKVAITILLSTILLGAWSCRDSFLTVIPQNGTLTDAAFFKTAADYDAFIFGIYAELQGVADMIAIPSSLLQDVNFEGAAFDLPVVMSPSNDRFYQKFWQPFYNMSSRANLVIVKAPEAPEAIKTRIEGEGKFFRGFAYFNLARAFGSVPLILETYNPSQDRIECTPESQIWDQVIVDLTEASQKLPTRAEWGPTNLGRATKGTALAFLANAYMYKKDWAQAEKASEALIALGEYNLLPSVRDAFSKNHENSVESIFEVQYREDNNFNWSGQFNKGTLLPKLTAPSDAGAEYAPGGGWGSFSYNRKYADSFDPQDERRNKLVLMAGEVYKGEDMPKPFLMPGVPAEATVAYSTKYWRGPQTGPSDLLNGQNVPYMRYSEFLLNYAEILFELGKHNEAYTQLNKVHTRAKLTALDVSTNKEVFMTDLMNERRWELGMEPNIWFHYTRTGRAAKFLKEEYNITFEDKWFKFAIPQKDRNQNPRLCQNEGYTL